MIFNFKKDIIIALGKLNAILPMITVDPTRIFAGLTIIWTNQLNSAQIINWTVFPSKTIF